MKVFLSCAVTGGMSVPSQSAAIPVTPEQIVDAAVGAHAAGAAIVHIHVREPSTGRPSPDLGLFREVLAAIGERCDAIVQPTTGGGVGMTIDERARVVTECRPEMATFNCGSFNFPPTGSEFSLADLGGNDSSGVNTTGPWLAPWMLPNTITCDDRPPVVAPPAPSPW